MKEEDQQVAREQHPSERSASDRLLANLGIDPNKWTVGDRSLALLGIVMVWAIVIVAVCGYVFEWEWTGLIKPKQRTFWDWLSLLIVPIVLALGGYLFTRSENRRTQDIAQKQRALDREIADQRRQDDILQTYLDQIGQLLLDKDSPLRQSKKGDEVRTLAHARTVTALKRLDAEHNRSLLRFLQDSQLVGELEDSIIGFDAADLVRADLKGADLTMVKLTRADLTGADLEGANLRRADLQRANLREADLQRAHLKGADLRDADLRDAKLSGAKLFGANLFRADLSAANLREARLQDNVDLSWAKLIGADLVEARLNSAKLFQADLTNANLSKADLRWADLSRVGLEGANLEGANLEGASLEGAIVTEEQLAKAEFLKGATLSKEHKHEGWLKTPEEQEWLRNKEGRGEDGEDSSPS